MTDVLLVVPYEELQEQFEACVAQQDTQNIHVEICHLRGSRFADIDLDQYHVIAARGITGYSIRENHPKVAKVSYTGLVSHPQYDLVRKQQRGSTGLMTFEIKGSTEDAKKVVNSLKVFKIGVSWGGFESLACMPHARQSEEACQWLGGNQNLIRIHCGLEGTEVLKADLEQALANI